ncbi:lipoprotein LpqH [Mycolicibacterium gadium]|uniref:Lipoprotein LpqH n=1 Tax=Mycolicibacterium gadium TaxID=1794 RepID=A0ABT6GWS5_MYCGU|nr:lipoprotein LpqH [Mycolicibacterium gadium]MDG5485809.1 lipoprotein LpqH [Mycolicibacterium gadium]
MGDEGLSRALRHRMDLTVAVATVTTTLAAVGCTSGYEALGTHTARVLINGREIADQRPIRCEQVQWVWFIESLEQTPGFTAQVRTGDTIQARLVRIDTLGGFTGSAWDASVTAPAVDVDADVMDGTFIITGTATGFYHDDPGETATATFEIRTDC